MTTIALRLLATVQRQGDRVGYVDLHAAFDPKYAAWCGVDLATLLLVRPRLLVDTPDLIFALIGSGGLGALVADNLAALAQTTQGAIVLETALRAQPGPLSRSPCALVILTSLPYHREVLHTITFRGSALAHAAALRLHVARQAWSCATGSTCASGGCS